jgi:hypothetical protein
MQLLRPSWIGTEFNGNAFLNVKNDVTEGKGRRYKAREETKKM